MARTSGSSFVTLTVDWMTVGPTGRVLGDGQGKGPGEGPGGGSSDGSGGMLILPKYERIKTDDIG